MPYLCGVCQNNKLLLVLHIRLRAYAVALIQQFTPLSGVGLLGLLRAMRLAGGQVPGSSSTGEEQQQCCCQQCWPPGFEVLGGLHVLFCTPACMRAEHHTGAQYCCYTYLRVVVRVVVRYWLLKISLMLLMSEAVLARTASSAAESWQHPDTKQQVC